jgi:hypothetical protein
MTEMLLKYLSWPVAVIVIALVVIFVFKRSLNTILQRGGLKIGGLSIDANTAVKSGRCWINGLGLR